MLSEYKGGIAGYFANLESLTNYIKNLCPIDNKFRSADAATSGTYDINPGNIKYIIEKTKETCGDNYAAAIFIDVDFVLNIVTTEYLISTINVIE